MLIVLASTSAISAASASGEIFASAMPCPFSPSARSSSPMTQFDTALKLPDFFAAASKYSAMAWSAVSLILSLVRESENQETGFQLQYTSFPPESSIITATLMTANEKGTMKSPRYVLASILARNRIAQERTIAMKRVAI